MAIMIPEKPRDFDPRSRENIMFSALESLPDEYFVVHSFRVNKIRTDNSLYEGEADFVIFHPQKGILCVEAKATRVRYEGGTWCY
ncbi:MAG: NERD domain-containing protein, partial [Clostridia bacterium]|nr:NERD domain-containing protein [Clostridia bacterium]